MAKEINWRKVVQNCFINKSPDELDEEAYLEQQREYEASALDLGDYLDSEEQNYQLELTTHEREQAILSQRHEKAKNYICKQLDSDIRNECLSGDYCQCNADGLVPVACPHTQYKSTDAVTLFTLKRDLELIAQHEKTTYKRNLNRLLTEADLFKLWVSEGNPNLKHWFPS